MCLRAVGVDPQAEGSRGEWLYGLARMTGRVDALRPRMIRALRRGGDSWTRVQQYHWLAEDALHGSEDARAGLRVALREHPEVAGYDPTPALRALGFEAFEIVLVALAARGDSYDVHTFLCGSKEELGAARTRAWSQRVAGTDPRVGAALRASERWSRRRKRRLWRPWSRAKLDAIVEGREKIPSNAMIRMWARRSGSRTALARLDARLATEPDPRVLERLLHAFFERPVERAVERVLEFARSRDETSPSPPCALSPLCAIRVRSSTCWRRWSAARHVRLTTASARSPGAPRRARVRPSAHA